MSHDDSVDPCHTSSGPTLYHPPSPVTLWSMMKSLPLKLQAQDPTAASPQVMLPHASSAACRCLLPKEVVHMSISNLLFIQDVRNSLCRTICHFIIYYVYSLKVTFFLVAMPDTRKRIRFTFVTFIPKGIFSHLQTSCDIISLIFHVSIQSRN